MQSECSTEMTASPEVSSQISSIQISSSQIDYLKRVLGIEGFILPSQMESALSWLPNSDLSVSPVRVCGDLSLARLIVLAAEEGDELPLEGEPGILARKMIQAMKVDLSEALFVEWSHVRAEFCPQEVVDAVLKAGQRPVLIFGENAAVSIVRAISGEVSSSVRIGEWIHFTGCDAVLMPTYSPRDLLVSQERKRQTWVHLQAAMKKL